MRHLVTVAVGLAMLAGQGAQTMEQRRAITAGAPPIGPYSPAVVAGGLVYVSGLLGTGADGQMVGPDVASQTRRILDRMTEILEAAGSSLGQTVSVSVFLKNPGDFEALNATYRDYFRESPPVRTTVVADLLNGALVEIAAIAVPKGATREVLHPAGWIKSPRPYSYIVRTDDLVFLSGLVSRRGVDDALVPGAVDVQTTTILDNAATLLKTAGVGLEDVVQSRVFITDDVVFDAMNNTYRTYFPKEPPARATAVARLMGNDFLVEVTLVATRGEKEVLGAVVSPSLPLSTAVRAGNRVFLSGVLGNTDANMGDPAAQTRELMTRISRTLTTAGLSFADVADSTVYLTDLTQFATMNGVYREFFPSAPPARATVGTRLVSRNALVEIMMTAVR
ncbi:MAG TPA: RidA family protein [Vicinamibacterales bacterium]|nr:RidA family protein [Vicinamibacterales bacterium]